MANKETYQPFDQNTLPPPPPLQPSQPTQPGLPSQPSQSPYPMQASEVGAQKKLIALSLTIFTIMACLLCAYASDIVKIIHETVAGFIETQEKPLSQTEDNTETVTLGALTLHLPSGLERTENLKATDFTDWSVSFVHPAQLFSNAIDYGITVTAASAGPSYYTKSSLLDGCRSFLETIYYDATLFQIDKTLAEYDKVFALRGTAELKTTEGDMLTEQDLTVVIDGTFYLVSCWGIGGIPPALENVLYQITFPESGSSLALATPLALGETGVAGGLEITCVDIAWHGSYEITITQMGLPPEENLKALEDYQPWLEQGVSFFDYMSWPAHLENYNYFPASEGYRWCVASGRIKNNTAATVDAYTLSASFLFSGVEAYEPEKMLKIQAVRQANTYSDGTTSPEFITLVQDKNLLAENQETTFYVITKVPIQADALPDLTTCVIGFGSDGRLPGQPASAWQQQVACAFAITST